MSDANHGRHVLRHRTFAQEAAHEAADHLMILLMLRHEGGFEPLKGTARRTICFVGLHKKGKETGECGVGRGKACASDAMHVHMLARHAKVSSHICWKTTSVLTPSQTRASTTYDLGSRVEDCMGLDA